MGSCFLIFSRLQSGCNRREAESGGMENFTNIKGSSSLRNPVPDLRRWCSTSDLVQLVLEAVADTNCRVGVVWGRSTDGQVLTAPLMLSVIVYAYASGILASDDIALECQREPGLLYLCRLKLIDSGTLRHFRRGARETVKEALTQVLIAVYQKQTKSGTKLPAGTFEIWMKAAEDRIAMATRLDSYALDV